MAALPPARSLVFVSVRPARAGQIIEIGAVSGDPASTRGLLTTGSPERLISLFIYSRAPTDAVASRQFARNVAHLVHGELSQHFDADI